MGGSVFRAIADPTRRRILERLRAGERSVTDLANPFRMSQPAVSQHLRILRAAGLVRERRQGRRRLYRINAAPLEELLRWAAKQIEDPAGHVWRLGPAGVEETQERRRHGDHRRQTGRPADRGASHRQGDREGD